MPSRGKITMTRTVGTVVRGIRTPIIRQGDDLVSIAGDALMACMQAEHFELGEHDVLGITEAVVARAQGNYASIDHIAADVKAKFPEGELGLIFPITSRNRFSVCLKGISKGVKKVFLLLSYPADEVGNELVTLDQLDACGVDPWRDVLTEAEFIEKFGRPEHRFTGVDYIAYYREIIESMGAEAEILLANDPRAILTKTAYALAADIHTTPRTQRILKAAGAKRVLGLSDILNASVDGSGFNPDYGLLGSNLATENTIKLFPRDCLPFVLKLQHRIFEKTGRHIEVMVYGDGAFKDPVGRIWELADPVVSPAYTEGLQGMPNEVKIKYLADSQFAGLNGDELREAIEKYIGQKSEDLKGSILSQGTTPRRITDLIGSLCDLTSGSGDKGTPLILIQGYFDNYASTVRL